MTVGKYGSVEDYDHDNDCDFDDDLKEGKFGISKMMVMMTFIMMATITMMTAMMTNYHEGGWLWHLKDEGHDDVHNDVYDYQDDSRDDQGL